MKYEPLKIYATIEGDSDLKDFVNEINQYYPTQIIEDYVEDEFVWVNRNDAYYLADSYVVDVAKNVYDTYKKNLDIIGFFISDDSWKNGKRALYGFKLGGTYYSYEVTAQRFRDGYEGTAEHEILHCLDTFCKKHAGMSLAKACGVEDWDRDVVHNPEYWKKGYYYDEVWKKIAPILSLAINNRRKGKQPINWDSIMGIFESKTQNTIDILQNNSPKWNHFTLDEKTGHKSKNKMGTVADLKVKLVDMLDKARDVSDIPYVLTSGKRTRAYNKQVGGVENSAHLTGEGADIAYATSSECYKIVNGLLEAGFTRIGIGEDFVHADIAKDKPQGVVWLY